MQDREVFRNWVSEFLRETYGNVNASYHTRSKSNDNDREIS